MSRSRWRIHSRGRWRCCCCQLYPFRLSDGGRKLERLTAREDADAADLSMIHYDAFCASMPADADEGDWDGALWEAGFE